jgi:hypothetical protein
LTTWKPQVRDVERVPLHRCQRRRNSTACSASGGGGGERRIVAVEHGVLPRGAVGLAGQLVAR